MNLKALGIGLLSIFVVMGLSIPIVCAQNSNAPEGTVRTMTVYDVTDDGWSVSTQVRALGCVDPDENGSGTASDDQVQLTLTVPSEVTISATDCCCPGDYYEIREDGGVLATTPDLYGAGVSAWGCVSGGSQIDDPDYLSSGNVTVCRDPGIYTYDLRDAGMDGHTQAEVNDEGMCPAGVTLAGTVTALDLDLIEELCAAGSEIVDEECPVDDPYRNHGKYVSCVSHATEAYLATVDAGFCEKEEISSCIVNPRARDRNHDGIPDSGPGSG